MSRAFKHEKSLDISLLDVKRFLKLIQETVDVDELVETHIYINEEGMELPRDLRQVGSLIKESGGYQELEYIAMAKPDSFFLIAEFLKGELRIRCKEQEVLDGFLSRWQRICEEVDISRNLIGLAVPLEAKRFIFNCLRPDGALTQWPGGPMKLEKMYFVALLKDIGLEYVKSRFAEFLIRAQNLDGGWGREPHQESKAMPTAVAILLVSEKASKTVIQKAIEFLLSKRKESGPWKHPETPVLLNAIVALSLSETESELSKELTSFVLSELERGGEGADRDYFSLMTLKSLGVDTSKATDQIMKQIGIGIMIDKLYSTSVAQIAVAINLFMDKGLSAEDHRIKTAWRSLINLRNANGGWPARYGQKSELFTTVLSDLAFKKLHSLLQRG